MLFIAVLNDRMFPIGIFNPTIIYTSQYYAIRNVYKKNVNFRMFSD